MTDRAPGPWQQVPQPPGGRERWAVPWGVLDCVGVLAVAAVLTVALGVGIATLAAVGVLPDEARMLLLPLPLATLAVVTLAWVHARHRALRRLTGPQTGGAREWLVGVAWGLGAFVAVNVVASVALQVIARVAGLELPRPQEGLQDAAADPALAPWLVLSAVLVAPLAEEVFFRGMLFQALRQRLGRWWGIALSAVAFAAVHMIAEPTGAAGLLLFVLILPLGVFLAWLFDRRGSLVTPIVVHGVFNLATVSLLVAGAGGALAGAG